MSREQLQNAYVTNLKVPTSEKSPLKDLSSQTSINSQDLLKKETQMIAQHLMALRTPEYDKATAILSTSMLPPNIQPNM